MNAKQLNKRSALLASDIIDYMSGEDMTVICAACLKASIILAESKGISRDAFIQLASEIWKSAFEIQRIS